MYVPWWAPSSPPSEEQEMANSRRRVRTSAKQFELILDFMEQHPKLATSQLDSHYTVRDRKREWTQFAKFLNAHDLGVRKDADKWRKTWFDWKCNVRAKVRSASGMKSLTPLEKRLIAVTGLMDADDVAAARREGPSYAEMVYEIEDEPPKFSAAGTSGHTVDDEDDGRAESVLPTIQSTYGESQDEYIVPTLPVESNPFQLVLSDVRSLAGGRSRSRRRVKQEVVGDDVAEDVPLLPSTFSAGLSLKTEEPPAPEPLGGAGDNHRQQGGAWDRNRPATDNRDDDHERADGVAACNKAKLEMEVLLATKRKLEAEERRAEAEAQFYEQEKRRSMALESFHLEEKRRVAAVADFHVEERRRAAAKVEVLTEHRNFYLQQQKTETFRRRLIQLEMRRLKRELGMPVLPPEGHA